MFVEADEEAISRRMVLVCGTSTCHMAVSRNKLFIPGVWGPFWSGMVMFYNFAQSLQIIPKHFEFSTSIVDYLICFIANWLKNTKNLTYSGVACCLTCWSCPFGAFFYLPFIDEIWENVLYQHSIQ